MSLEDYVVDVETAKKLEEKGFKGEAFYHYARLPNYYPIEVPMPKYEFNPKDWDFMEGKKEDLELEYSIDADYIPTYLLAQVLEALHEITFDNIKYNYEMNDLNICYTDNANRLLMTPSEKEGYVNPAIEYFSNSTNPATAAAKLWLWCEEMGHVGGEK